MLYDKTGSLAETFFPAALRSELPAIDGFKAALSEFKVVTRIAVAEFNA